MTDPRWPRPRAESGILILLFGAMLALVGIFLVLAPNDPDFFWHLKTGEWIWQNRGLPGDDPFNYMNPLAIDVNQHFTLRAYWLAQVLYHLIHAMVGMPGILALKFLSALLLIVTLLRLRRGDPVVHAALVLAVLPLFLGIYPLDRPQVFSFLFFAVLLALLEQERASPAAPSSWRSYFPVPLLMLLWSNMHGGHLLGQITVLLFIVFEGVKFAHPALGPMGRERYRRLLIVGGIGLIASLVNPNSWRAVSMVLGPKTPWAINNEYVSTVVFFRSQPLMAIFWGALALSALSVVFSLRRPDITWIVLLAGLGYQGFNHIRYVPFFTIAALPVVGSWLSAGRLGGWGRHLVVAASVALAAVSTKGDIPTREGIARAMRVDESVYPVRAADFVIANNLEGNLYNTYLWGGYLLWRLGPERKVFVDGRGLSTFPTFQSSTINVAFSNPSDPPPLWKRLLRQYGVGYIIIPRIGWSRGVLFDKVEMLRTALLDSPEWVPVFADAVSLVFVQNLPEHKETIRKHAIPRDRLLGRSVRS